MIILVLSGGFYVGFVVCSLRSEAVRLSEALESEAKPRLNLIIPVYPASWGASF